jgi:hypothetical protein
MGTRHYYFQQNIMEHPIKKGESFAHSMQSGNRQGFGNENKEGCRFNIMEL